MADALQITVSELFEVPDKDALPSEPMKAGRKYK
ncbi:hypothetical protein [Pseudochrobactrum sp. AO18b]